VAVDHGVMSFCYLLFVFLKQLGVDVGRLGVHVDRVHGPFANIRRPVQSVAEESICLLDVPVLKFG